jgi:hypothetical protein
MFAFLVGGKSTLVEWVHVDNLCHAHMIASVRLREEATAAIDGCEGESERERDTDVGSKRKKERMKIRGKAFFISDWKPINQYVFMTPLVEGLGYVHSVRVC